MMFRFLTMIAALFASTAMSSAMADVYSAEDWLAADRSKTILLDVRSKKEYDDGTIEDAVHIPMFELQSRVSELGDLNDKTIVVFCEVGGRARVAAAYLEQQGATVELLNGHMRLWRAAGRPVVRAK